jgi:hypothetical protein
MEKEVNNNDDDYLLPHSLSHTFAYIVLPAGYAKLIFFYDAEAQQSE